MIVTNTDSMIQFHFFFGKESPLSNWHPAGFWLKHIWFDCVEQAMMYSKAKLFNDDKKANQILATSIPAEHKILGREVQGYVEQEWVARREHYVYMACLAKFTQNPNAAAYLRSTGNCELVEASPYDKIWGIGIGEGDIRILDRKNWRGQNLLGKVLMRVRDELINKGVI